MELANLRESAGVAIPFTLGRGAAGVVVHLFDHGEVAKLVLPWTITTRALASMMTKPLQAKDSA
jgi:hypothetical protein